MINAGLSNSRLLSSISSGGGILESCRLGGSNVLAIMFPESKQLRSRKVVSRSNSRSAGKYPSWKMKRMLHWESIHELNAFRLLDCDRNVPDYREQPCQIVYAVDGIERVHYPDIQVTTTVGKELWEVKPRSDALEPEVLARTSLLSLALPRWGYAYKMVFAEDLARQPRLSNANLLLRFAARAVDDHAWEAIRHAAEKRGRLIWSEACRGDYGVRGRENLCSLALRGILAVDMNAPISATTQFVLAREL